MVGISAASLRIVSMMFLLASSAAFRLSSEVSTTSIAPSTVSAAFFDPLPAFFCFFATGAGDELFTGSSAVVVAAFSHALSLEVYPFQNFATWGCFCSSAVSRGSLKLSYNMISSISYKCQYKNVLFMLPKSEAIDNAAWSS